MKSGMNAKSLLTYICEVTKDSAVAIGGINIIVAGTKITSQEYQYQ
jgi:hypothetical protein